MIGPTPKWRTFFGAFMVFGVLGALAALFPEGGLAQEKQRPIEPSRMRERAGNELSGAVRFLLLYQEGSISPEELKRFVEGAELVIKTKSSPKDRITGSQTTAIEEMTLEELAATISPGAKEKPRKGGVQVLVAVGTDRLSTLFKTYGPVLVLNFTRNAGRAMATATPPSEFELIPLPVRGTRSGENLKTVVITFGLTSGTEHEFTSLFCRLYHGDCGGPIGKPIPIAESVTVRKYRVLEPNEPRIGQKSLREFIEQHESQTVNEQGFIRKECLDMKPDGCHLWKICELKGPNLVEVCFYVAKISGQWLVVD